MSKKQLRFLLILVLFILGSFKVLAQNKKLPLTKVLSILEQKFEVSFSYGNIIIDDIIVEVPPDNLSLLDFLGEISKQVEIEFVTINDNFIAVAPINNSQDVKLLDEVLISNFLTSGVSKKSNGAIVVNPSKFGILPGFVDPDVLQTTQALPGITSVDENIAYLNVRGGTQDQNLVLYEGIKMYQTGHFFGLLSAFNPTISEEIHITKNGTSAAYGDGVSSVIDMRLSNKKIDSLQAGFGINLINFDGLLQVPITPKIDFQFAARRSITDVANTPPYGQFIKRIFQNTEINTTNSNNLENTEDFYFYDIATKLNFRLSKKDKLSFNFLNIANELDQLSNGITPPENLIVNELSEQSLALGINYQRNFNDKLSLKVNGYISDYLLTSRNNNIEVSQNLFQENEVRENGFKVQANYALNKRLQLSAGYQSIETAVRNAEDLSSPAFSRDVKEVINTHAAFGQVQLKSKDKTTNVKGGLRVNYFDQLDSYAIEPRLSVSQRFFDYFILEILGEAKSQTTSQVIDLQKDFLGIQKQRWVLANNDNIPVIKSEQASIGLSYKKKGLLLSAEAFVKNIRNITTRSQGFQNQYQFVNAIGDYQVKGVDLLIDKKYNEFGISIGYSNSINDYQFNDLNDGKLFPSNNDLRNVISGMTSYDLDKFKIAVGCNWHSGRPYTEVSNTTAIIDENIVFNSPNGDRLPSYFRVDFSTTSKFTLFGYTATLGLSLWNILNNKNIIERYYTTVDNTVTRVDNESLGLVPNLNFRMRF